MDRQSIAHAAVSAPSRHLDPAVDQPQHDERIIRPAAAAANNTFERVDSFMNDDGAVALAGLIKDGEVPPTASPVPSAAAAQAMGGAQAHGVRILGLHEWKQAALSLAQAFEDDHSSLYFLDTPERAHWTTQQKWDLHLKIMEYITYAHLLKGLVVSAGPNYDCVGLW